MRKSIYYLRTAIALIAALLPAVDIADAADGVVKVGVTTAIQLDRGKDTVSAAQMAADEINAAGGIAGRQIEIVVADEGKTANEGVAAINKLISEKVDVVVGGYNSGITLAQLPHLSRAKTIYIGVGASAPAIQEMVEKNYGAYKYIFRVNPMSSVDISKAIGDFIVGKVLGERGFKKVAIVAENAKWARDMIEPAAQIAKAAGVEIVFEEYFDPSTPDFAPLFSKVAKSGAQYMIPMLAATPSDVFVKQWHDMAVPVEMGGVDTGSLDSDFFQRIGGMSLSETGINYITRAPLTPKTIPWWDGFVRRFGHEPQFTAPGSYDAIHVYADAVKRAGSFASDAVVATLETTRYVGVRGTITFDKRHDVIVGSGLVNALWIQWQDGGTRAVIWPKDLATGSMISPPWLKKP